MGRNKNLSILIGHLGGAPELDNKDGCDYARFRLATNERWKTKAGEERERTDWHTIVAFRGLARSLESLEKGAKVYVEGKLRTSHYQPEDDGPIRTSVEIHASEVIFL